LTRLPVAKEGLLFILPALCLSFLCYAFGLPILAAPIFLLALFFAFFFRNPQRSAPAGADELISPADGRIMGIEGLYEGEFLGGNARRVSIFMSVSDVHVNRAPCEGTIEKVEHRDGRFKLAFKKGVDEQNERNYIVVRGRHGERFLVVQIAGFLARRIICYVRERDTVRKGAVLGMIAFGSRVDLYMPTEYVPTVREGEHVKSGFTVLARKKAGGGQ
jgi:phosphatidylserine decarboxylase